MVWIKWSYDFLVKLAALIKWVVVKWLWPGLLVFLKWNKSFWLMVIRISKVMAVRLRDYEYKKQVGRVWRWVKRMVKRVVKKIVLFWTKFIKSERFRRREWQILVHIPRTIKKRLVDWFYRVEKGKLSWYMLFKLAFKNLKYSKSRTLVTAGAISIGVGAIVLLVSFGYGLQEVVTKRLIQSNSMRMIDVQSDSTALSLNKETLDEIKNMSGVYDTAPMVNMAASLSLGDSRMDVVVMGVDSKYFDYVNIVPVSGEVFSSETDERYHGQVDDSSELLALMEEGEVLGVSKEIEKKIGEEIDERQLNFRISDEVFVALRETPEVGSKILGYVRGSILERYRGMEVWGDSYSSPGTAGKAYQDSSGEWWGKWLRSKVLVYKELAPTVYIKDVDEQGIQRKETGYLVEAEIQFLSMEQEMIQKYVDNIVKGEVLGLATGSAEMATGSATQVQLVSEEATDSGVLQAMISQDGEELSMEPEFALVEIKKQGGKEVVISTGLLNVWELEPEDVIGNMISIEYIVSGGVIPGLTGRVLSNSVEYKVVGVNEDDDQPLVFVPLSDLESMGVTRYTLVKVLADDDSMLTGVRERIESMGFMTRSVVDTLIQVERLFGVMRFLLGAFGMIALVVALFGMFNTLTISLMERTREIGVMKTLGTTDYDVVRLFLTESLILGVMGGVVGILLGVVAGQLIDTILGLVRGSLGVDMFRLPIGFLLIMILVSVLLGVITGLYPAKRAKKISALNALRYE